MAEFEVKVVKIDDVQEHPDADRLTLVKIGGYTCIANKHDDGTWRYQPGDLVVYVPENSVVPEWMLRKLNMWKGDKGVGMLAGKQGNRVKAIKLRGIFSEGLLYPVVIGPERQALIHGHPFDAPGPIPVTLGEDVAHHLDITKYEPVIPTQMSGEVFYLGHAPLKFDLEPWEKYPDLIKTGEEVVFTEKLHGTFTGISIIPDLDHPEAFETDRGARDVAVWSKGMGSKGLVFKDNEANAGNLYANVYRDYFQDNEAFWNWCYQVIEDEDVSSVHILGETYGKGVQDLSYGADKKQFRIFGIAVVSDRTVHWFHHRNLVNVTSKIGVSMVPIVYKGAYDPEQVYQHRDGKTVFAAEHIREGVVIETLNGRYDPDFGYIRLKAVSPDYKLRKGGTEYN